MMPNAPTLEASQTSQALLLALLLSAAVPVAAQAPAQPSAAAQEEETFFESIEVNVVNVDVYVTDRSGNPIAGLTREDFTVFEDGKPVEVTNFFAVSEGKAAILVAEAEGAATGASALEAVAEVPEDQKLHLAVFIDNSSLTPQSRNKALRSAKSFLSSTMRLGDRVLVASYDGGADIDLRQEPTGDPEAVLRTLEEVAKRTAGGVHGNAEKRRLLSDINRINLPGSSFEQAGGDNQDFSAMEARGVFDGIKIYAQARHMETRRSLAALDRFVASLSGLPGRKAVLFLSGGLPMRPGEAIFRAWENKFPDVVRQVGGAGSEILAYDSTPLLKAVVDRANANRITFYALGASEDLAAFDVEQGGLDAQALTARGGGMSGSGREVGAIESAALAESLTMISGPTGGMAVIDAPSSGAILDRMRRDFDWYYSLGYVPERRPDGKRRKIEVKVKDPALKLRYREGYHSRTAEERMADKTTAALMLGVEDNPLGVSLEFPADKPDGKGNFAVGVLVRLPLGKLALLPQEHVHEGRLSIFVGARDPRGRSTPIQKMEVPIRIPNDQLMTALAQEAGYVVTLLLPPSEHVVAVGVRDELGNADAIVRASHIPGQATPSGEGK